MVDTNIIGRMSEPAHPQHRTALDAAAALAQAGNKLCIVPQVLYEFWVTATRPITNNGLGLSAGEAAAELAKLKSFFFFLPDTPAIYPAWERLVILHQVIGKIGNDARLVSAMAVHGITRVLTSNKADFARFPGVVALDPNSVATMSPPPP